MSILDVVGPVMIGPSSSHTAGAAKIGIFAAKIFGEPFDHVDINLYNSFAETGRGHGTDKAILGGVLGMSIDDERLLKSYDIAKKIGLNFKFHWKSDEDMEPNTAKILFHRAGKIFSVTGVSVGGGVIEIREIDGYQLCLNGYYPALIVIHRDVIGTAALITEIIAGLKVNIAGLDIFRKEVSGDALAVISLDTEFPKEHVADFYRSKAISKVIRVERLEA